MCRMSKFGALIFKWAVFIKPSPSRLRDLCGRGRKTVRANSSWQHQGHALQTQYGRNIRELKTYTSLNHTPPQSQYGEDKVYRKPNPLPRNFLQSIPSMRRKINVFQWSVTVYINHTPEQSPRPIGIAQHKTESIFLCAFSLVRIGVCFEFHFCFIVFCFWERA